MALAIAASAVARPQSVSPSVAFQDGACPVTLPNGMQPPGRLPGRAVHGNGALWVGLYWPNGTVLADIRYVRPDGSIDIKFGWWRGEEARGELRVTGRRLDGPAPPLRAEIPSGYDERGLGFQPTGLFFPTEGCWEVTGMAGGASLTFVTRVVRISLETCPVTTPNGRKPPSNADYRVGNHGNGSLFVALPQDGTIRATPPHVLANGSIQWKLPWWRGPRARGRLRIEGQRLDAKAPPLRASVPDGYGPTGFQSIAVIFPTAGCWSVTGIAGKTHLTFVIRVVKAA